MAVLRIASAKRLREGDDYRSKLAEISNEVIVLLSGGIDSAACLAFHESQNSCSSGLFINYGQAAAEREYQAALDISDFYKVPLKRIAITGFRQWGVGFVPGRNAFLASLLSR